MGFFHILILAIVQGITEFLPVSSSGHLVLTHALFGSDGIKACWDENRLLDVAVHVGTLFAVMLYFRHDLFKILRGITTRDQAGTGLAMKIILSSLPVILAGLALQMWQPSFLCLVEIVAWTTLIFGVVLGIADKFPSTRTVEELRWRDALWIGLAQILALIPGTSRSGITMTAARFLGYSRVEAARYSLLLSIIAISGAGLLGSLDLFESNAVALGTDIMLAVLLSFVTGYAAIFLMMRWLSKATFMPFAIYRILLGGFLLLMLYAPFS